MLRFLGALFLILFLAIASAGTAIWYSSKTSNQFESQAFSQQAQHLNDEGNYEKALLFSLLADPANALSHSSTWENEIARAQMIRAYVNSPLEITLAEENRSVLRTLDFDPSGKYIVSAGFDDVAKIWDIQSGEQIASLEGHSDSLFSANFSPNGANVVTTAHDQSLIIWESKTGTETFRVDYSDGPKSRGIGKAKYFPDGKKIFISRSSGNTCGHVINAQSGELIIDLEDPETERRCSILSVSIHESSGYLVAGDYDGNVRYWNTNTGEFLNKFKAHEKAINEISFGAYSRVYTVSQDGSAKLWNIGYDGKPTFERLLTDIGEKTASVVEYAHAGIVLVGSNTGEIRLLDLVTDTPKPTEIQSITVSDLPLVGYSISAMDVSEDQQHIAIASFGGSIRPIRIWNIGKLFPVWNLSGWGTAFFSTDDNHVTVIKHNRIEHWNLDDFTDIETIPLPEKISDTKAFLTPDRQFIAAITEAGIQFFDIKTGEAMKQFPASGPAIEEFHFDRNGKKFVQKKRDRSVSVVSVETGVETEIFERLSPVHKVDISPDGQNLAISKQEKLYIVDSGSGQVLTEQPERAVYSSVNELAYSPNGEYVLTTYHNFIYIRDSSSLEVKKVLSEHTDKVLSLDFSPDGSLLVSRGRDDKIIVWDLRTGEIVRMISRIRPDSSFERPGNIDFSADGTKLLTTYQNSYDTAYIWSLDEFHYAPMEKQIQLACDKVESNKLRFHAWDRYKHFVLQDRPDNPCNQTEQHYLTQFLPWR